MPTCVAAMRPNTNIIREAMPSVFMAGLQAPVNPQPAPGSATTAARARADVACGRLGYLLDRKALRFPIRKSGLVPEDVGVAGLDRGGGSLEAFPAFRPVAIDHHRRRLVGRQLAQIELVLA